MRLGSCFSNENIYGSVISLLRSTPPLNHLLQIHAIIIKTSLHHNIFIITKFLRQCLSKSSPHLLVYAHSIFDQIHTPDAFVFNTLIRAYLHSEHPQAAIQLFKQMWHHKHKIVVDSFSFSLALQACGRSEDRLTGKKIHTHLLKLGFGSDLFVQTALLEMYARFGSLGTSRQVFDEMSEPDLVSYNVLLAMYVRVSDIANARLLFDRMPDRDLVSWNTMIHGHASSGDVTAARQFFDSTINRDLVSWSSMIAAYSRNRQPNEALLLFHEMQLAKVIPDGVTMVSILSSCGEIGALGIGKTAHEHIERSGIKVDVKLGTSLIDMYAKCGDLENSLKVFHGMHTKDVLTWNAMIMGLASNGCGEDAFVLFYDMISRGVKPNDITFVGLLTACTHAGFVSKGLELFSSMSDNYSVSPKIEHYGCIIDLLGRSGHLTEARELIRSMPFVPDAIVWRALLGACRMHNNVELAEEAVANLIELEPRVDGHYVLLSNIYAQAKQWDGVANVRKMIRGMNIMRIPGSSSIEVDNMVHEFVAGDNSHPKSEEIYKMLAEMINRLSIAGYRPKTSLVLQDVEEQAKVQALTHHSEKLAIAFGLLSTSYGTPIRIVKNLRVCDDCHSAAKLVSKIYNRQIIVRDRNRFHHFKGGTCSCSDYW